MNVLYFVLLLLAVFCFAGAASRWFVARVDLVALGLALAFTVPLIQTLRGL